MTTAARAAPAGRSGGVRGRAVLARRAVLRGFATAVVAGVVAGCASLTPPPALVSGRLSLQVAAHDGRPPTGVNAAFDLVGDARAGELRLSAPFGPQIASARWAPEGATLRTSDGETRHGDLDALARHAFGEPLPLQALPDWLRGRAWPGAPSRPAPDGFEQLGWTLDLSRFGEGFLVARREAAPTVTLRVRVSPA